MGSFTLLFILQFASAKKDIFIDLAIQFLDEAMSAVF
jgi:hypothetical protein